VSADVSPMYRGDTVGGFETVCFRVEPDETRQSVQSGLGLAFVSAGRLEAHVP
jgi:hypothetical protein